MDLKTAKKLISEKIVINNRINRHHSRKDWREKNGLSDLFFWMDTKYPGHIKYQIAVIMEHDGVVPTTCEECGINIQFNSDNMSCICSNCKKERGNLKRKRTNLSTYGHISANGNKDVQEKTRNTKKQRYGSETWNNPDKAKQTCNEKYGASHFMKTEEGVQKVLESQIEKYGDVFFRTNTFKDKFELSMLENHGVKHPMYSPQIKKKQKDTTIENHGVENAFQSEIIKEKIKATKIEKYGNSNYNNRNKAKETCVHRYGVENVSQDSNIRNKIEENNISNYGVRYPIQLEEKQKARIETFKKNKRFALLQQFSVEQLDIIENISDLYNQHINEGKSIGYFSEKYGFSKSFLRTYFYECGYVLKHSTSFSLEQMRFAEKLEDYFGFKVINNDRNVLYPKEIDIWIPEHNLGIEYHGSYWHSVNEDGVVDEKHYTKYNIANEKGVRLIQAFDREVENKFEQLASIIATSIKHHSVSRIYARKCEIKEISNTQYKSFCEINHIQGYSVASVKLGAFYNNELVAVMSFAKSRFTNKYEYEMIRFCNKLFYVIPGIMSKLFKHFVKTYEPKTIVSYADCRFFTGASYEKLGFSFVRHSSPNYWYVSSMSDELESRMKYQKHKLSGLLESFDSSLTEKQNMLNNGYRIAYDAGNNVYEWGFS